VQVGDPIREGWEVYARLWRSLLPLALVVEVVVTLVSLAVWTVAVSLSLVVALAGGVVLEAVLVQAIADARANGAEPPFSATFGKVWPRLGPVAAAGLIAAIAIVLGLFLAVVPGLWLLTIWSLLIPVIVLEGARLNEAFGRSRELVRGYAWTVFGVVLATVAVNILPGLMLGFVVRAFTASQVVGVVLTVGVTTIVAPFTAAILTSMYFRLSAAAVESVLPAGAAYTDA
jgi:hypothetical protein